MIVKSVRGEVVNLTLVTEFRLEDSVLLVKESNDKIRKYTLTNNSTEKLRKYIDSIEKE